jgi:LPXTG-motif cell wall-anchored protein
MGREGEPHHRLATRGREPGGAERFPDRPDVIENVKGVLENLIGEGGVIEPLNPLFEVVEDILDALNEGLEPLLEALGTVLDLRVGHMEAAVEVPEGGLICEEPEEQPVGVAEVVLPVTGTAAAQTLVIGGALALAATGLGFLIRRRRAGL